MIIDIISSGGIGDCLLALKHVEAARNAGFHERINIYLLVRDEVFNPINYLFGDQFHLYQADEDRDDIIRKGNLDSLANVYGLSNSFVYFVCPDSLYGGPRTFPYKKYNLCPLRVRNTRIGGRLWKPNGVIYCALNSSTPQYQLGDRIKSILKSIALNNLDKIVYFNNITKWNNTEINNGDFSDLPKNVVLFKDQEFNESLEWLKKAEYVVTVDNGIFHISNELNISLVLLDTRLKPSDIAWRARWRYNLDDSIPAWTDSISIGRLVKMNLEYPATTLIPRQFVIDNIDMDFKQLLLDKGY